MKTTKIYIGALFAFLLFLPFIANAQPLEAGMHTVKGVIYEVYESEKKAFFAVSRKTTPNTPENKETIYAKLLFTFHYNI